MNKRVKFSKKYLLVIFSLVIFLGVAMVLNAFGGNQPSVVGHSAGELDLSDGVNGIVVFNDIVGIGTDNPQAVLDVQSTSDDWTSIRIKNTATSPAVWELRNIQRDLGYMNNGFGIWGGNEGEEEYRLTITADNGNVGIGTFTPQGTLDVNGDIYHKGSFLYSDKRWKENIKDIENPLEKVILLQGVTYNFKQKEFSEMNFDDRTQLGFVAQDIEKIVPEVVITGDNGYKYIDYGKLSALLSEAIKEQQKIIEEQNLRISEIEKRMEELEN